MQLYLQKGCKQSRNGQVSVAAFSSFQGLWGPLCGWSWPSAKSVQKLPKPKQQPGHKWNAFIQNYFLCT